MNQEKKNNIRNKIHKRNHLSALISILFQYAHNAVMRKSATEKKKKIATQIRNESRESTWRWQVWQEAVCIGSIDNVD